MKLKTLLEREDKRGLSFFADAGEVLDTLRATLGNNLSLKKENGNEFIVKDNKEVKIYDKNSGWEKFTISEIKSKLI